MSPAQSSPAATRTGSKVKTKQPVLMLLDGHSLAYRAFFALPAENFKTHSGQTTNAVYGFTSMLINLLRDEEPTHIAAAFDVSRKTFRSEMYPEYKAQRSKSPDEFNGQVDLTKEVLDALGVTVMAIEGYEADDIIATLATQAREQGFKVLIVTGDRDSLQLVDASTTVLYPRKGVSDLTRFTPPKRWRRSTVSPPRRSTRTTPRCAATPPATTCPASPPGLGEKTASKWIREYGSLASLVDHVDEVKARSATPACSSRLGADQPSAHRTHPRHAAAGRPRRPRDGRLGSRPHPPALRRPRVPRPARPPVLDPEFR